MKIFTCKICGEVYLGKEIPGSCPFCGVANKNLIPASVWKDENDIELTEISKNNLELALQIELSNAAFYRCAFETLSNKELGLMFKGLSKVEREHASVFKKILKSKKDEQIVEECDDDPKMCLEESFKREERAVNFYSKALEQATEPRLMEVFRAIMEVEKEHIELDVKMKANY